RRIRRHRSQRGQDAAEDGRTAESGHRRRARGTRPCACPEACAEASRREPLSPTAGRDDRRPLTVDDAVARNGRQSATRLGRPRVTSWPRGRPPMTLLFIVLAVLAFAATPVTRSPLEYATDPCLFIDDFIKRTETGAAFVLSEYQRVVIGLSLRFDPQTRLRLLTRVLLW